MRTGCDRIFAFRAEIAAAMVVSGSSGRVSAYEIREVPGVVGGVDPVV